MSLKRKSKSDNVSPSESDDEGDGDFEVSLLDSELSDDGSSDESGDEADSESSENSDLEDEHENSTRERHINGNKNESREDEESESLFSDASSEFYSSDSDVILDAEGNPRKLLPEIDPHYDSDSSTFSEVNTIGDIDIEKYYGSMPHIGYDVNGRRIMRPAAGAALDQLLDTIELPKGWTGIVDKDTGELKNLTEEELEIIKRIRRQELPNDEIEVYDVQPLSFLAEFSHIGFQRRTPSRYPPLLSPRADSYHRSTKPFV